MRITVGRGHSLSAVALTAWAIGLVVRVAPMSRAAPSAPPVQVAASAHQHGIIQFLEQTIAWYRELAVE
jgi:hypothetical protein